MSRYIILMGAPGAGKGTQATFLARRLGVAHVATGELFREAVCKNTELGRQAKAYLERGALVPDDITTAMVKEQLAQPDYAKGAVLDGFPRTLEQAQALDKVLAGTGKAIEKVIFLKVSEEEILRRLAGRWLCKECQASYHQMHNPPQRLGKCDTCGVELYQRLDDTPETVRTRLEVYRTTGAPLIEYYRAVGRLAKVSGEQDIEAVQAELMVALEGGREQHVC